MAFVVTARQSGNADQTTGQTFTTSSATPTASSLFLVFFGAENDSHSTAHSFQTPTGGGYTYTQLAATSSFMWETSANFASAMAGYRADVGGSPSAHTVVVDAYSGASLGVYSAGCIDITGHGSSTPVQVATGGAAVNPASSTASGTVTFGAAPTAGNLIVSAWFAGADVGGGFASPTAGAGKSFTQLVNQNPGAGYTQTGVFYRVADGAESATITCSDLGQSVGNYAAVAVEIAAPGGAPTTSRVTDRRYQAQRPLIVR